MVLHTFIQLLPILVIAGGGWLLSRLYPLSLDTLVKVITDFLMPMLVFQALYTSDISGKLVIDLAGATTLTLLILLILAYGYALLVKIDTRAFVLPVIFMNSGFLGIPLMKLWGGTPAMNLIVIYDQIQTIYIFTLGILIIAGGIGAKGFGEIIKSPILWAIFAGFLFRFAAIPLPEVVLTTLEFGGNAAPPLAAFTLGVSLSATKIRLDRHLAAALLLRFAGGFLAGMTGAAVFGLTGLSRTVVLAASSLPSAVFTSVLPLRYGVRADFAGTMVVTSTILGVAVIPLVLWIAG